MQLPETLRSVIEGLVEGQSIQDLARHYQALSDRYRREAAASSLQIANPSEALAYVAARLPATYGTVSHACNQLAQTLPDFTPTTLLDIGSGPGTAALAALHAWSDSLNAVYLLEPNPYLRELSQRLFEATAIRPAYETTPLSTAPLIGKYDLVLASYVLNEIPELDLEHELTRMWEATAGTLVLIEPGTPLGFDIVIRARAHLISLGANLAAPCPHHMSCPLAKAERWCHMSVRIERSALHKKLKNDASLGYEDEKFSYLIASRTQPHPPQSRLLGHPHGQKVIELELCKADGAFANEIISKRDPRYKTARKSKWGDAL